MVAVQTFQPQRALLAVPPDAVPPDAVPAARAPTYADIEALPPHVVGEILGGELVVSPRPAPRHANAGVGLLGFLGATYRTRFGSIGGWEILYEPELSLGVDPRFDPVVPDLAGWRRETMPRLPDTAQVRVVPDWVCEILSPSTQRRDRVLKLPFYGRAGVRHVWLVDPIAQTLEVFRLVDGLWRLAGSFGGDEVVRAEPFDGVDLPLAALWPEPETAPETPLEQPPEPAPGPESASEAPQRPTEP
jgi:Uma2 family endonuclease